MKLPFASSIFLFSHLCGPRPFVFVVDGASRFTTPLRPLARRALGGASVVVPYFADRDHRTSRTSETAMGAIRCEGESTRLKERPYSVVLRNAFLSESRRPLVPRVEGASGYTISDAAYNVNARTGLPGIVFDLEEQTRSDLADLVYREGIRGFDTSHPEAIPLAHPDSGRMYKSIVESVRAQTEVAVDERLSTGPMGGAAFRAAGRKVRVTVLQSGYNGGLYYNAPGLMATVYNREQVSSQDEQMNDEDDEDFHWNISYVAPNFHWDFENEEIESGVLRILCTFGVRTSFLGTPYAAAAQERLFTLLFPEQDCYATGDVSFDAGRLQRGSQTATGVLHHGAGVKHARRACFTPAP